MTNVPGPRAIAFFDLDNTLLRGASLYYLGQEAWRRGLISLRDVVSFGWKQTRFVHVGENATHLARVRARALDVVTGHRRSELVHLCTEIFDTRLTQRLWPETVAAAQAHLAAGQEVWLVTATVQEVADVIAERLGFTGALGTVLEATNGVFTGRLSDGFCHGDHKAVTASARAAASNVDLAECWAYSDSHNDLPLLSLVGHPVAVNPDANLHRHALAHEWPVMRLTPARDAPGWASKKRQTRGA